MLPFFSAGVQAECHAPLTTCAGFISVAWCAHAAAPNPYGGSTTILLAMAENRCMVCCAREPYLYPPNLVSIPHKAMAARLCDALLLNARACGAVGVSRVAPDGRWIGETFDGVAMVKAIAAKGERIALDELMD